VSASWTTAAWIALSGAGALVCLAGLDCIAVGWHDLRRGDRAFTRRTGLYTALTGVVLLLVGGGLLWWGMALRGG
jgi:hypothetical protein